MKAKYPLKARNATGQHRDVKNIHGTKVYTALLTQTSTNAPVATVLENSLGATVTWTRSSAGQYVATCTGAFTSGKTLVFIGTIINNSIEDDHIRFVNASWASADAVNVHTMKLEGASDPSVGSFEDGYLDNTSLQILVYP